MTSPGVQYQVERLDRAHAAKVLCIQQRFSS